MTESFQPGGAERSESPESLQQAGAGGTPSVRAQPHQPVLAAKLSGRLRCLRCRYNLAGLSVLAVCPECGVPVRATILAAVDPYASELQPLIAPRSTAAGLVLWALGAFAAALATWALRALDIAEIAGLAPANRHWIITTGAAAMVVSAVGAAALVRPHRRVPATSSAAALAAIALYVPLIWVFWWLHAQFDPSFLAPYLDGDAPRPERLMARLGIGGLMALILIGLRANYRLLAARSVLLRSGRVERQAINAVIASVAVAAAGDLVRASGIVVADGFRAVALAAGTFLVAVGSMLVTIGIVGVLVDLRRIVPAILDPAPSLEDIIEPEPTLAPSPAPGGGPA